MMRPTKVWPFKEIYSIEVVGANKLTASVLIDWKCGQSLYDRACMDLFQAMNALTENQWTVSDCEYERVDGHAAIQSFSVVNQFVDEDEALQLAAEFKATLQDLSGMTDQTTFSTKASAVVRRTAQFGLTQAQESPQQFEKWLLIWACDIAGELGEYIDSGDTAEAGDVLWGITALCLLLDIPVDSVLNLDERIKVMASGYRWSDILIKALGLLDVCKKITRDGMDKRPIDRTRLTEQMRIIFHWIDSQCDVDESLDAVEAKLRKRYPNGFTAEDSVSRIH